jgi:hypothetical protein
VLLKPALCPHAWRTFRRNAINKTVKNPAFRIPNLKMGNWRLSELFAALRCKNISAKENEPKTGAFHTFFHSNRLENEAHTPVHT